jgi:hypothetical protein
MAATYGSAFELPAKSYQGASREEPIRDRRLRGSGQRDRSREVGNHRDGGRILRASHGMKIAFCG